MVKTNALDNFASFACNEYKSHLINRLSSHPDIRPSWENRPKTMVKFNSDERDLALRCHNMRRLDALEQSANIFFIRTWYQTRATLLTYQQKRVDEGSPVPRFIIRELATMDATMKTAQVAWEKKFGETICERLVSMVSPKKKRKRRGNSSDSSPEAVRCPKRHAGGPSAPH